MCGAKNVSKFYLTKNCPIFFKLWHFVDKVPGENILKFQPNGKTISKLKFCSELKKKKLWGKRSIIIFTSYFWGKIVYDKKIPI